MNLKIVKYTKYIVNTPLTSNYQILNQLFLKYDSNTKITWYIISGHQFFQNVKIAKHFRYVMLSIQNTINTAMFEFKHNYL